MRTRRPFALVGVLLFLLAGLAVRAGADSSNQIANADLTKATAGSPDGWFQGYHWGVSTPAYGYGTTDYTGQPTPDGKPCLTVSIANWQSGDEKWYFSDVPYVAGSTPWTYSESYKSDAPTALILQATDANGQHAYVTLNGNVAAANGWTTLSAQLTQVPAGTVSLSIWHSLAANGHLSTRGFFLGVAAAPAPSNLIYNPSGELAGQGGNPDGWTPDTWNNRARFSLTTGHTGKVGFRTQVTYSNAQGGDAKWVHKPVAVEPLKWYRFDDWYRTTGTSNVVVAVSFTDPKRPTEFKELPAAPAVQKYTHYAALYQAPAGASQVIVLHVMRGVGTLDTDDYSLVEYTPSGFRRGMVMMTFDDSLTSQYMNARPKLNAAGFHVTYFGISGLLDDRARYYMRSANLVTLSREGNEIGSHTVTHPDLTKLRPAQVTSELATSQKTLQKLIGKPVRDFALPYGTYNPAVLAQVAKYYDSCRTTDEGIPTLDTLDPMKIQCHEVHATTTQEEFDGWLQTAALYNLPLVLTYHGIEDLPANQPNIYSVSNAQFQAQIAAIQQSGLPVLTMHDGLAELVPQLHR